MILAGATSARYNPVSMTINREVLGKNREDLTGRRYGRYIVLGPHDAIRNTVRWVCRCDCGTEKVVWTIDHDAPDIASPLLTTTGRLYFHKGKSGQLSCVDAATGKPHYVAQRVDGVDSTYGSPIEAGGNIYLTGRSGHIVVIKDSNELSIVSTNPMEEILNATPAPVDSELFIRGDNHLFCIAAQNRKMFLFRPKGPISQTA